MAQGDGAIARHFVTLGSGAGCGRQVHYRRAGRGAPILLLHQSPRHGGELEPLMRRLADRACVIAPDTPGYGLSDPLPADAPGGAASIDAYADAMAELMTALGIARAPVYGLHTGGCIALRLAVRRPDRVAALVVDGVLLATPAERADFLENYLPPLRPVWDGSHLVWAWARLREQSLFFPWYRPTAATRMHRGLPPPDRLHRLVLELLMAGDGYRGAYGAALAQPVADDLRALTVPALAMSADDDVLAAQFDRRPALPDVVTAARPADRTAALDLAADFLIDRMVGPSLPPAPPVALLHDRAVGDYVRLGQTHLRLRRSGTGVERPVLLLHGAGESSAQLEQVTACIGRHRPAVALDLPGAGDSDDPLAAEPGDFAAHAALVAQGLEMLGMGGPSVSGVHIFAHGAGAAVAVELALGWPDRVRSLHLAGVSSLTGDPLSDPGAWTVPDLSPEPVGTHLIRAWHFLRNRELFHPWSQETADAALCREPALDPALLQQRLLSLLKAGPRFADVVRAQSGYRLLERLRKVGCPAAFWTGGTGHCADTTRVAAGTVGAEMCALPGPLELSGDAIAAPFR